MRLCPPSPPPPSCVLPHRGADIKVFLAAVVEDLPQVPGAAKGMGEIFSLQAQEKKKRQKKQNQQKERKQKIETETKNAGNQRCLM